MRILIVCVGNVCRSPLAERLLQMRLDAARPGEFVVSSAGMQARPEGSMDPTSARELVRLGGDPAGFASQPVTAELLEDADLVLAVTKDLRTKAVSTSPKVMRRAFTLAELVAIVESDRWQDAPEVPVASVTELIATAAKYRPAGSGAPDLDDPYKQLASVHARVADEIADLVDRLAPVLAAVPADAA